MNPPSTEVSTPAKRDVKSLLQSQTIIAQLQRVATKYLPADRLARLLLSAVNKTPQLLNCSPESVLQAGMTCAQLGIEPDGRHAHLIPYGQLCQFIIDYKGLVLLGRRNGIESIVADTIGEFDEFTYYRDELGTHFRHVPKFGGRGKTIGAYSTCKIDGQFDVEVMTAEEIESIRNRSRAGKNGPWVTDWNEMAKKTVIRRHSKRWPLLAEVAEAIVAGDDDTLEGAPRQRVEVKSPSFLDVPARAADDQVPGAEIFLTGQDAAAQSAQKPRRGRPPKPVESSTASAPANSETNQDKGGAPEPASGESRQPNYVRGVTGLLKTQGWSEADLIGYCVATKQIDDSITSITEMSMACPSVLQSIYDDWTSVQDDLRAWKETE